MSDYYSFSTEYSVDKLYRAVMERDKAAVEQLKSQGVSLTENVKRTLVNGGGSMMSNKPAAPFWYLYITDLAWIGAEGFIYISRAFYEEIGEPLYYSESLADSIGDYYYDLDVFTCIMECYNQKKINKKKILQGLIRKERIDLLKICANAGWLSQTKKRDEMIQYAADNGKTECAAWLMDFKNRTADFAAEREKAEKKMQRELNASPDSLTALKQIWSFTKREDGTLKINGYKGGNTVITVPEKLGKNTVTAIGYGAFSPHGPRKTDDVKSNMKKITRVILPKTINFIDKDAFYGCVELQEVNIPDGVTEIEKSAFRGCISLKSIEIPESVTRIGMSAFCNCESLTEVNIPKGVTKIEIIAFGGCESLTRVNIPVGVTEIEEMTFMDCPKLQSVTIPESVERIAAGSFVRCDSLRHIELPNSVTQIDMRIFMACDNLETVTIPASVTVIKNPEEILRQSPKATVIVEPDSYAEKCCKKYKIPYKYKEDV